MGIGLAGGPAATRDSDTTSPNFSESAPRYRGKDVWLDFDGVYLSSTVYLNGHRLGRWASGYAGFRYDLTKFLRIGSPISGERRLARFRRGVPVEHRVFEWASAWPVGQRLRGIPIRPHQISPNRLPDIGGKTFGSISTGCTCRAPCI